jgi:small conductance mechanosensitive channel
MSNYQQNTSAGNPGHVGLGEKIKDAVTPGQHSTQGYTGVPGNNPELGQQRGTGTTGNLRSGEGGFGGNTTSSNQGAGGNTGMGGFGSEHHHHHGDHGLGGGMQQGGQTGMTGGQTGMTGGQTGMGGIGGTGAGGPQEHYEKKTHNTSDHNESESFETSNR